MYICISDTYVYSVKLQIPNYPSFKSHSLIKFHLFFIEKESKDFRLIAETKIICAQSVPQLVGTTV